MLRRPPPGAPLAPTRPIGRPSRSTQIIGWSLFAALDLATRWTVYEDFGTALRLTLILTPVVILLAQGLAEFYRMVAVGGQITRRTLVLTGLACLLAAGLMVLASTLLRAQFGSPMPDRSTGQELRSSGFYFYMIFLSFSFIQISTAAEAGRRDQERRAARAEADALRAELQRLRLQLDPHFLLNALNGILDEIMRDPNLARQVLEDLTSFLRHVLAGRDQLITSVGEEIDAVSAYLGVQSARFGENLDAVLDVDAAALPRPIASFLLQPLVENAIEHGRQGRVARVRIALRPDGDRLLIEVSNPGHLQQGAPTGTGVGLETVRARLALHYPDRHAFTLQEAVGEVTALLVLEGDPCSAP